MLSNNDGESEIFNATIDDASEKAEVQMRNDYCAKTGSCSTEVYEKEVLPTVIRLTYTLKLSLEIFTRVIDIDRSSLDVVSRQALIGGVGEVGGVGEAQSTFTGKCKIKKVDKSKKLL